MSNSEIMAALISVITILFQAAGIYFAIQAVMISRTPQAAIGWGFSLVICPYIAIPLFLVFGESRFSGYVLAGSGESPGLDIAVAKIWDTVRAFRSDFPEKYRDAAAIAETLRKLPPLSGNRVRLLVDGEQTFPAIFEALDAATEYAVLQFYIVNDDGLGQELKKRLIAAARRGVKCWLLYDEVGSKKMTAHYYRDLREAGVRMHAFVTNRQMGRRFQINFRNHRKLAIFDGRSAFIGGLNIGNEYIGKGPLGPWRDTHLKLEGPAVQALQASFVEDWYYATREVVVLPVRPEPAGDQPALVFAAGPTQPWSINSAVYGEIISDARERLWIASPYFVPDPTLRSALAHAALRGVDVRIILPKGIDHLLPWLSSYTFYPAMRQAGVKIYRYQPGFMHQKVLLADDDLAIVGSVNLDYRSFMLNFELAAAVCDRGFARDVEKMFEADFARSIPEHMDHFETASFFFRLKCRLAALMSPEQ